MSNKDIFLSRETLKLRARMCEKSINAALKADNQQVKELKTPKDNITKFEKKKDFR